MSHHVVDDDVCVQIWPVTPPDVHEMVSSVAEYSGGEWTDSDLADFLHLYNSLPGSQQHNIIPGFKPPTQSVTTEKWLPCKCGLSGDRAAQRVTNLLHSVNDRIWNSSDDWSCGGKMPSLETQEPFTAPTGLPWTAKTWFLTTWCHQTRPNYELSFGIKGSLGHGWFKPVAATTFTLISLYNNVMMDVMNNKLSQNNIKKKTLKDSEVWKTQCHSNSVSHRFGRQKLPGERFLRDFTFRCSVKNEEQRKYSNTWWIIDKGAIWRCK